MQWLRLYHDTINDPKWRVISVRSKQPVGNVLAVWMQMLVCASAATERGTLEGWDDETSAAILGYDPEAVAAIREAMQGRVLDGFRLSGWDKRQRQGSDDAAERQRRSRAAKQQNPPPGGGHGPNGAEHYANGSVTGQSRDNEDMSRDNEPMSRDHSHVTASRALQTEDLQKEITDDDAGARHIEIGRQVAARAGMPPDPEGKRDYSAVLAWLSAGADPDLDIFPAVARTMARVGGRAPFSLAYFTSEVSAGLKARTSPLPEPDPAKVAHLPRKQTAVSPASQDRRGISNVLDQLKAAAAAEVRHG